MYRMSIANARAGGSHFSAFHFLIRSHVNTSPCMAVLSNLRDPLSGFDNCMLEASHCYAGGFAKRGRGSTVTNRLYII